MRHRFRALNLIARALTDQYTCCLVDFYEATLAGEPRTFSVVLGFEDRQGLRRFNVHAFVRPDRTIAASGLLDPKFFFDDAMNAFKVRG
jgi:hypothetical protein